MLEVNSKRISLSDLISFIKTNVDNVQNNIDITDVPKKQIIGSLDFNESSQLSGLKTNLYSCLNNYSTELLRFGVLKNSLSKDNINNVSLLSSILTCVKEDFILQQQPTQQIYISQLNNNLSSFVGSDKYTSHGYKKIGFKQTDIVMAIKYYQNAKIIWKVVADYFHINIFFIDIANDQILLPNKFNTFKKTIMILIINNDIFEPVLYKNNKFILNLDLINDILKIKPKLLFDDACDDDYELKCITKIQKKNIGYSFNEKKILRLLNEKPEKNDKPDEVVNNDVEGLNGIVECSETNCENIPDLSDADDKNTENIHDEIIRIPIQTKQIDYKKMKLDELQNEASKLNISITIDKNGKNKKKTKKELIDDIEKNDKDKKN